jgi:hypothetical protein
MSALVHQFSEPFRGLRGFRQRLGVDPERERRVVVDLLELVGLDLCLLQGLL